MSLDSETYGVGLSITQLNDIKKQFDQVNFVKSKKDKKKGNVNKNIYQNKYHNFSEKFSLEDRLLLVRLYNRYTEENCMTFKTFARKFKKKANEWINNNREERHQKSEDEAAIDNSVNSWILNQLISIDN